MLTFDSKGTILQNKDSKSKPTGGLQQKTPVEMYPRISGPKVELYLSVWIHLSILEPTVYVDVSRGLV